MAGEAKAAEGGAGEAAGLDLCDQIFTYEGVFNTKGERIATVQPDALPATYADNSRKEELCLEYVENFVRQFEALFPERAKLFVTPRNECGIAKFVCTTVRPTQLPFKALYKVSSAAAFFSHYLTYEPLANPTEPPEVLPSPSFTLDHQVGDAFDLSTVLCSYLVGAGYDAYCVHGYAPRDITLLDRTKETCPLAEDGRLRDLQADEEVEEITIEDLRELQGWTQETAAAAPGADLEAEAALPGGGSQAEGEGTGEEKVSEEKTGGIEDEGKAGDEQKAGENEGPGEATDLDGEGKAGDAGEGDAAVVDDAMLATDSVPVDGALPGQPGQANSEEPERDPYDVKASGVLASEYLRQMAERAEADMERKTKTDDEEEAETVEPDHLEGRRVHSWVLVRAGKRMVEQSFFVEPTTGRLYHVNGSPYLGIEAIWNNKNYWVNMQQSAEDPMNISYNLDMDEYWEYIFVDPLAAARQEQAPANDVDAPLEQEGGPADEASGVAEGKEEKEDILDLPASWVEKLALSRESFRRRYNTTGQRTQLFFKSKLESYAEHLHVHGLVKRLTLFDDRARTMPIEVREYFANRRDKLTLRVRHPLQGRVVEHFAQGRASGLRQIDEVTGKSRDLLFYQGARLDGLACRCESMGSKIVETFEGRDDHLVTRSLKLRIATVGELGGQAGPGGAAGQAGTRFAGRAEEKKADVGGPKNAMTLPRASQGGDLSILKMKQVFSRDDERDADQDIAKRTFHIQEGTISVIYHYARGKITRSSRLFNKDPSISPEIKLAGSFAQPLRQSQIDEEFQLHLQAEKDCYQNVRDAERETQDILALRKREEANIVLEKSIFDSARDRSKQDSTKEAENMVQEEKDPRHVDYLTPFLQHIPNLKRIKREEAEAARDACLKSLKERLLERANIIQCRLDDENAQLAKKQAAFQRSRDHVDGADQEFERFCSEAMFRIQILEQRLARHEESALSIYANLDQKLRNDPRIEILYSS